MSVFDAILLDDQKRSDQLYMNTCRNILRTCKEPKFKIEKLHKTESGLIEWQAHFIEPACFGGYYGHHVLDKVNHQRYGCPWGYES